MLIADFFENQQIFLTGGSGFIGKAFMEKLLRSCPKVGIIYVLIRSKKGKSATERLNELMNSSLFDRLREEQPQTLSKVQAINGDCSQLGLGISPEDLAKLQNVTIICHSAASVRFDDNLRDSILLNTRGTFELLKIAETLKKLRVFLHVSTTYCYPDRHEVEERIYDVPADWRTTIKMAETYDTETLDIFNAKYSEHQPNTYTFTKGLAEQVISEYKDKLPVVVFRPSIVISSLNEPVPGWLDNFNGPIGMLVACGIGIMRTNYGNPDLVSDYVPVDVVVRAMLIACYKRGLESNSTSTLKGLDVYNCASANTCPITIGRIIEIGKKTIAENPFEKTLWVPGGSMTRCPFINLIRFITFQIFMAVLVDCALRLMKQKPFLLKLQRRIYSANMALHVFITNEWIFQNEKFMALDNVVPTEEYDNFAFVHFSQNLDFEDIVRNGIRGAKMFLLNEPPDSTRNARRRFKIFKVLNFVIQTIFFILLARFVWRYLNAKFQIL